MTGLIDAHFHIWRRDLLRAPGMLGERFPGDVGWDAYAAACGELALAGAIAVQADGEVGDGEPEVDYLESVAAAHPRLRGIIAAAPLEADDARAKIAALARHPLVRGIRRSVHEAHQSGIVCSPGFLAGVRALADFGLVCDLNTHHWQLAEALAVARAAPETAIVLNHLGKPDVSRDGFADWRAAIDPFADLANVAVKLSVVAVAGGEDFWRLEALAPYAAHVLARFGPERVMWSSNWPVAGLVIGTAAWLAAAQAITERLGEAEKAAVFHDNAVSIYGLGG